MPKVKPGLPSGVSSAASLAKEEVLLTKERKETACPRKCFRRRRVKFLAIFDHLPWLTGRPLPSVLPLPKGEGRGEGERTAHKPARLRISLIATSRRTSQTPKPGFSALDSPSCILNCHFGRMPSVYIKTYGCQMNERDSEAVAAQLVAKGYTLAPAEADADVILLNTCSVRDMRRAKSPQ